MFIMIVMGFNQGMQPIAGYNFGARQFDRLIQVLKYTVFCGVTVTTVGFLAGQIFPRPLIYLFTSDETLTNIAVEGLRIVLICFPVVGFQMVTSSFFQSIGMAKKAIFLVVDTTVAIFDPVIIGVSIHLGNGRSLDEYAGCGCHCDDRCGLYVKMAIETSESVKKFIL